MVAFLPRHNPSVRWWSVCLLLAAFFAGVWLLFSDTYQSGGNTVKYNVSAEVIKRILFTGDVADIDADLRSDYGRNFDILKKGWASAITDERPIFYLYLAAVKLAGPHTIGVYYLTSVLLALASLALLSRALEPRDEPLFFLLSGLLLAPCFLYIAYNFEPHLVQIFWTCVGVFFYARRKWSGAFFSMSLAFFTHGSSLVMLLCLSLLFLWERRMRWGDYAFAAAGGLAAWGAVELFEVWLFMKDTLGVLPHVQFVTWFFEKSSRLSMHFDMGNGVLDFVKTALIITPLGIVGALWSRTRLQAALVLVPLILYAVATKGHMPGSFRVLLPYLFLGHAYFIRHLLATRSRAVVFPVLLQMMLSVSYLAVLPGCLDLSIEQGQPVAIESLPLEVRDQAASLHWNLRRYHPVVQEARTVYGLRSLTRLDVPNIPDPDFIQANVVLIALSKILPQGVVSSVGSVTPHPPIFSLTVENRP